MWWLRFRVLEMNSEKTLLSLGGKCLFGTDELFMYADGFTIFRIVNF